MSQIRFNYTVHFCDQNFLNKYFNIYLSDWIICSGSRKKPEGLLVSAEYRSEDTCLDM